MASKSFKIRFTKDNRKVCLAKLTDAVNQSLSDIGDYVVSNARNAVPVDTGALRDSIMKDVDIYEPSVRVGSPLDYSAYIELGTGPNYEKPPKWVINRQERGHHDTDPWWYMGDDGEWHLGWFIRAQPYLRPSIINHATDIKRIFKRNLENA